MKHVQEGGGSGWREFWDERRDVKGVVLVVCGAAVG
jgi:hypothetical protein